MKTLRAVFGIVFIVVVAIAVVKLVPPYYSNYELQDAITDEARMNTYTPKSVEEMRDTIWKKCKELDVPVTREQVNVQREGQSVAIWLDYTVHVDLPGYPVDLNFHPSSKNKSY
ncbi:MAG: DUF4845 domain-containing protein [Acidobacteriia bacterium]|nr:DUF4845 domain-containing protein [Terriglobia bacterium]